MPMGWGPMGWGEGVVWMPFMLLFWALVIAGIVLVVQWARGRSGGGGPSRGESAMDILKRRYASGEIGKEEFERMKADLR